MFGRALAFSLGRRQLSRISRGRAPSDKYTVFDDADSVVVRDVTETPLESDARDDHFDAFEGFNVQRGVSGVFDIEDLVDSLRRENAADIFVSAVPSEHAFVDYMCIVTGRSYKHMLAIAEFTKKLYKRKASSTDRFTKIEGKESVDWIALDLGNIALHIFSNSARKVYDLEQLWSVGRDFDAECHKQKSDILHVLETHSIALCDLKPAEDNQTSDEHAKRDSNNTNENVRNI